MVSVSPKANINYLAQFVKIGKLNPVPNSDRLLMTYVQGNVVVVPITVKEGDLMVYFPVESEISEWFLKENNLYAKKELNSNPEIKGYVDKSGRVRCIKLRSQPSQGLLMPINSIVKATKGSNSYIDNELIGKEFDTVNGQLLVKKYVVPVRNQGGPNRSKDLAKEKETSKVIDGQFRFHVSTPQLGKNISRINPLDTISITRKLHGTSGVSAHVECKTYVSKAQKISCWICNNITHPLMRLFGGRVGTSDPVNEAYDYLYSSRTVIKNDKVKAGSGFYREDVWAEADKVIRPVLKKGMTMYYEIVGYLPSGGYIQKGYDYGCIVPEEGEEYTEGKHFKVYVYRITMTNQDGFVTEYTAKQVQEYCERNMLTPVPEVFYGWAEDFYPIPLEEVMSITWNDETGVAEWREKFLEALREEYLEIDCNLCANKVPDEGVVIRKEGLDLEVYKFKSFKFLERETKELDEGEQNIEDAGEVTEEN